MNLPAIMPPGAFSATALSLPEGLPLDEWQAIGAGLGRIGRSYGWWVGDWWAYGHRYGERMALVSAPDWDGPAFRTCHNAGGVCKAFESDRRRSLLSFSHHAEVAALPAVEADELLDEAERLGWSSRDLRERVYLFKNRIGAALSGETCAADDLVALAATGARFGTIYADPAWLYDNQGTRAATGNHYAGMTVDEIASLPVDALAADDAHLHLWTTNAFLFDCPRIMAAWGFEYKSCFVWVKPTIGIGNYWRVSHEYLLLGVRGSAPFRDRGLISWGAYDRGPHSAKPEQIRDLIERASPGPRLELFARHVAPGWTVWGNEIQTDIFYSLARAV